MDKSKLHAKKTYSICRILYINNKTMIQRLKANVNVSFRHASTNSRLP